VELPHLAELSTTLEGEPVRFISITSRPVSDAVRQTLTESGVTYETFFACNEAFDAYGVRGIPTTVIIDHAGRLMYRHVGFREGDQVMFLAEIQLLLSWIPAA